MTREAEFTAQHDGLGAWGPVDEQVDNVAIIQVATEEGDNILNVQNLLDHKELLLKALEIKIHHVNSKGNAS